ncbi:MAG: PKD domain-containing protein, partial [Chitinophagales bacterium]
RVFAAIQIDTIFFECDSLIMRFSSLNANASAHNWDFDNGITSTDSTTEVTFLDGIYNGNYIVEDTNLICKTLDTAFFSLEILPEIKANIAVSDSFGCIALNVNFTNQTNILVDSLFWNFGDGNTSNLTNPNNIYNNIGNYNVSLIASDTNTCNLSDTAFARINTVDDRVFAAIQIDTIFFECDSLIMRFSSLNANANAHNWDFDNGITSTDSTVEVTFLDGIYNGNYIVEDTNLICKTLDTVFFSLEILPEFNFTSSISDSAGCLPLNVFFNAFVDYPVDSFSWHYGDGNSGEFLGVAYTYTNLGSYTATFYAIDSNTCNVSDSIKYPILVTNDTAVADVNFNENLFTCDSLQISGVSNNLNSSHFWDFGDGFTSTEQSVSHTYSTFGDYIISYILYDSTIICNPYDTVFYPIHFEPVVAEINLSDTFACIPFTINYNTNTLAQNYFWQLGDGNNSFSVNGTHTYTTVNTFTISLFVQDTLSCNVLDTAYANVITEDTRVIADFNFSILNSCDSLLSIQLDNQSTNGANFEWYFDGGNIQFIEEPGIIDFTTIGNHEILLIAINDTLCNNRDTIIRNFELLPNVSANFTAENNCENQEIILENNSILANEFIWNFGDGNTSAEYEPIFAYTESGIYNISLTSIDSSTCNISDVLSQTIEILDFAQANFETDSAGYIYPDDVLFTNISSSFTNFLWEFGDGETDFVEENPLHNYKILYDIKPCLTVWNEFCGDTICKNIYIDFIELVGVPNSFSPNGDGINDVLYVEGVGIETLLFKIYNRWGELIFESNNQEIGWDGNYNNVSQELEVYTYLLEVVFINGKTTTQKGNITLLR